MMMNSSPFVRLFLLLIGFSLTVFGHSCLRCANWNPTTGECLAGPRNEGVLFEEEAYLWNAGTPICQSTWANPISSFYSNGSSCPFYAECPDPMGSYSPGETFTIMWWARNHAIADEDPDTIFLYLSPVETENQGADASEATFDQNLICSAPYMSCGGLNGNTVPCWTECTMPSNLAAGVYTMLWTWPWQGVIYTTCTDITISSSGSVPAPSHSPAPSPSPVPSPSVATTSKATHKATTSRIGSSSSTSSSSSSSSSTSTSTSSSSSSPCIVGYEKCVGTNQYSTCSPTRTGSAWSANQNCATGLSCFAFETNYIQCH